MSGDQENLQQQLAGAAPRRLRLHVLGCLIAALTSCSGISALHRSALVSVVYGDLDDVDPRRPIVFLGDTQRTWIIERIGFREQNDYEREQILMLVADENPVPGLIAHLGDMVLWGSRDTDWRWFDELIEPLAEIPLLPALGNHDFWGSNEKAWTHLTARFPQLKKKRWYIRRYGPLALVWLDSNRSDMEYDDWLRQFGWYEKVLDRLEHDPSVRGVVILSHYPPFTNNTRTSDERDLHVFLHSFCAARKTMAWISGHAHGYERLPKGNKTFLVTGGAGGPRVHYRVGRKRRHDDTLNTRGRRPFNYVRLSLKGAGATILVRGLQKGQPYREAKPIDEFELSFPTKTGTCGSPPDHPAGPLSHLGQGARTGAWR